MISRLEVLNYKCLRHVDIDLDPFHVFVGPNASGKSTFLDAISLLGDLVTQGVEKAILKRAKSLHELVWKRKGGEIQVAIEMKVPENVRSRFAQNGRNFSRCRYEVRIGLDNVRGGISLLAENFFLLPEVASGKGSRSIRERTLFPSEVFPPDEIILGSGRHRPAGWKRVISLNEEGRAYFRSETTDWNFPLRPSQSKAALAMVPEEERFPISNWAKQVLSEGVQVLVLNSRAMREPCRPDMPLAFRADGANLPIVVRNLLKTSPDRFHLWIEHLKTVLPSLESIEVHEQEVDLFLYLMAKYSNSEIPVPSWLLSEGTLRLFALTLLAYLPAPDQLYLIEEPENGIHPKALEAVHQSLSSVYDGQVLCATHSPLLLGLTRPSKLLCFALSLEGATDVVKGSDHPALKAWKGQVALETLYAAGVLG